MKSDKETFVPLKQYKTNGTMIKKFLNIIIIATPFAPKEMPIEIAKIVTREAYMPNFKYFFVFPSDTRI